MNNAEDIAVDNVVIHAVDDIAISDDYDVKGEPRVLVRKTSKLSKLGNMAIKETSQISTHVDRDAIHWLTLYT